MSSNPGRNTLLLLVMCLTLSARAAPIRTPKGAFAERTVQAGTWTPLPSVSVAEGASLLLFIALQQCGYPVAVRWGATAAPREYDWLYGGTASNPSTVVLHALHGVTAGAAAVTVETNENCNAIAVVATEVQGLDVAPLDQRARAMTQSTAMTVGPTPGTTTDSQYVTAVMATSAPVSDLPGTWGGDTPFDGQRVGTDAPSFNITLSEGYGFQSARGTRTATKSGFTQATWTALLVTYKAAPAAAGPPASLTFAQQPADAAPGAPLNPGLGVRVAVVDVDGNLATGATDSITLVLDNNAANATLGGSTVVSAVGGVATFSDLTVDRPGSSYTLTATSGTLGPATSSPFAVSTSAGQPPLTAGRYLVGCGCGAGTPGALAVLLLAALGPALGRRRRQ